MKNANVSPLLVLLILLSSGAPGWCGSAGKQAASKPDVVVKKNPDGTVEVGDGDNQDNQPATRSGGVTYRPAPPGTIHYSDGTVVTRNADGSVEVTDQESMHPTIHTAGYSGSSGARHHATTHSGTKKASHHSTQHKTK